MVAGGLCQEKDTRIKSRRVDPAVPGHHVNAVLAKQKGKEEASAMSSHPPHHPLNTSSPPNAPQARNTETSTP